MLGSKKSDQYKTCTSCGNDQNKSVSMFDVCFQVPEQNGVIITLCDKCVAIMFDKSLKARCVTDSMTKTPQQMRIINARKRLEIKQREKERNAKQND